MGNARDRSFGELQPAKPTTGRSALLLLTDEGYDHAPSDLPSRLGRKTELPMKLDYVTIDKRPLRV
jgi:hypothetical protein